MNKFEKIAEIKIFDPVAKKDVIETLENKGFYICFEENWPDGCCDLILMKKFIQ